ncbi:M16 family metallopeptidase [Phytohabitans kaempferiae]|uniref:M16 family metallopeptidase n=1 Tax=Phytohabitans kaempferiae TaxID=1620943 RepID=A0ABV6M003_9ACTN
MKALPDLGPTRKLKLPKESERTLHNGLTVIAIRRPAVPLVEVRLRVPFARAHLARVALLSQTLFSGTADMSTVEIAAELQKVGGGLSAGVDPDRLMVSGNGLVTGLERILELLGEVLSGAAYPGDEVATERERLADRIQVAQSQPSHLARVALIKRMYGKHPYAVQTPEVGQVRAVRPAQLRALHGERLHPAGATLVLVGDITPERALDTAERVLGTWNGGGKHVELPPTPPLEPGPLTLVDRPGSVQSSLRVALPAVDRTHPDHAALQLANLLFGGYFSSRWVENIREDKGYTYGPHSVIEHNEAGSCFVAAAEVATEVTGPALLETYYELGRLASVPPKAEELEQARQYALGTLQLGMSTQAGLATLASTYAGSGLRLNHLPEYAAKLAGATLDDVAAAGATYLAPARAATVVLGDAERIEAPLRALTAVERA